MHTEWRLKYGSIFIVIYLNKKKVKKKKTMASVQRDRLKSLDTSSTEIYFIALKKKILKRLEIYAVDVVGEYQCVFALKKKSLRRITFIR